MRDVPDVTAGKADPTLGRGVSGELQCNLRAGVPGTDHQHRTLWHLAGSAIVSGVQLRHATRIKVAGEVRRDCGGVGARGQHQTAGPPAAPACGHLERLPVLLHGLDPGRQFNRQAERRRVCPQVVGHGVLAWAVLGSSRKRQVREMGEPGRGEQPQRVPPLPPTGTNRVGGPKSTKSWPRRAR